MIIKKYKAKTQEDAILLAKEDLGIDAIVMNIKTIKPRGIFKWFKKNIVELTAAIDDNNSEPKKETAAALGTSLGREEYRFNRAFESKKEEYAEETQNAIEEKINSIAKLLEQQITNTQTREKGVEVNVDDKDFDDMEEDDEEEDKPANKVLELIKSMLYDNEVKPEFVDSLMADMGADLDVDKIDNVLSSVYQKIVLKLGEVKGIEADADKKPKIIFFVGNTGVGKTTTMAKLASKCKLEDRLKVAMMSVDTYRIAAIEQIKIYANILDAPMEVVYTPEDMKKYTDKHKDCDLIFVDTAGRSHRNEEQKKDLESIVNSVEDYEKEVYLVVSAAVKYADLTNIAKTYSELFDYKLIITKIDETKELGNILNLKLDTDKQLSYVTWGQNVPDDIGLLDPQVIAKKLLGGAN